MLYECECGYAYNEVAGVPEINIEPGTMWADLPDYFVCPHCGAGKEAFSD